MMIGTKLVQSINWGDFDTIKKHIKESNVNSKTEEGLTALMRVCSLATTSVESVRYLLKIGADPNLAQTSHPHSTALHHLCKNSCDLETIKTLLAAGANPNLKESETHCLPLHFLCSNQKVKIEKIQLFLKTKDIDINCETHLKSTPLHLLCNNQFSDIYCIQLLLNFGADPKLIDSHKQQTAFHIFCQNHPKLKKAIFQNFITSGTLLNHRDANGMTPLFILTNSTIKKKGLITFLLEKGANPSLSDNKGVTPLINANNKNNQIAIREIKEFVSKKSKKNKSKFSRSRSIPIKPTKYTIELINNSGNNNNNKNQNKNISSNDSISSSSSSSSEKNDKDEVKPKHTPKKNKSKEKKRKKSKSQLQSPVRSTKIKLEKNYTTDPIRRKKLFKSGSSKILRTILEFDQNEMFNQSPILQKNATNSTRFHEIPRDHLTIIQKIGEGSSKKVYKGKWLGNVVAISKLKQSNKFDTEQINSFMQEFLVLCSLRNPNILTFYGACTETQPLLFVTEYCNGGDLYTKLQKNIKISKKKKIQIALQISRGVHYLHSNNLVHRDLKSPNILLDHQSNIKIIDFGLAKTINSSRNVQNNTIVGTPRWMAPELLRGEQNYTNKIDIYSLGIILWEISKREIPFKEINPFQFSIIVGIKKQRPEIQENDLFYELITMCWDHDPENRPNIQSIINHLENLL
ncbi:serine/threonine-protein kinase tnni3k-related [Anaeramoeba flamelloides]|uniref:Serine/threonine-protein kinase tnni3k-related n=1 Tax=Anaeramoeba flamelloides TaxID=1746091 RepID=A0AAV7ZWD3_9EUKA|nr:serine/threonine-protein kinase tnni3k-related [Anaeramoeba flamelloides]